MDKEPEAQRTLALPLTGLCGSLLTAPTCTLLRSRGLVTDHVSGKEPTGAQESNRARSLRDTVLLVLPGARH